MGIASGLAFLEFKIKTFDLNESHITIVTASIACPVGMVHTDESSINTGTFKINKQKQ